jgi:hypothetical protein
MKKISFLFFLSASIIASSQTVSLKQIGKETILFSARFIDYAGNYLYTLDNNSALYKVDLNTGVMTRLGNAVYKNTRAMFVLNNQLFSIEVDGSMNRIDPVTGAWSVVSPIGEWNLINRVIAVGGKFYTTQNGALYYHPTMSDRLKKQIGDAEFYDLGYGFRTDSTFFSMISGTLSKIDLSNGKWTRIGEKKAWKYVKWGDIIGNKLYTIESPGSFYVSDLSTGTRTLLDDKQFQNGAVIFATGGKLYSIFRDGQLFEVMIK